MITLSLVLQVYSSLSYNTNKEFNSVMGPSSTRSLDQVALCKFQVFMVLMSVHVSFPI